MGPGIELLARDSASIALQVVCSGETKGEDDFRGVKAGNTAVTNVFIGPRVRSSRWERFTADLELGVPVHRGNSELQIMPDYRLRAAVGWHF